MTRGNGPERRRPSASHGSTHPHSSNAPVHGHGNSHPHHVVRTVFTNPSTPGGGNTTRSSATSETAASSSSPSSAPNVGIIAHPPKVVHAPKAPSSNQKSNQQPPSENRASPSPSNNPPIPTTAAMSPPNQSSTPNPPPEQLTASAASTIPPTNTPDPTQAILARDTRITALESQLRLLAQSSQSSQSSQSEQAETALETAAYWQAKHSTIHTAYLRADTELRLLRAEVEVREAERGELREGWERLLRKECSERDGVISELRGQVRGLKEWVSKETRGGLGGAGMNGQAPLGGKGGGWGGGGGAVSDEVFGEGMGRLANGLQNWVIVNYRRAKIDLSKTPESTLSEVSRLVPMYEDLIHTAKVHFLQSIVSGILVESIFQNYFPGLSDDQAEGLRKVEELLAGFADSPEAINHWRSQTLSLIRRGAEASSPPPSSQQQTSSTKSSPQQHLTAFHSQTSDLVSTTTARIIRILDAVTVMSSSTGSSSKEKEKGKEKSKEKSKDSKKNSPSSKDTTTTTSTTSKIKPQDKKLTSLTSLLQTCVSLSRLLSSQRARFVLVNPGIVPHQRNWFDKGCMEDISGLGDESEDDDDDDDGGDYEYGDDEDSGDGGAERYEQLAEDSEGGVEVGDSRRKRTMKRRRKRRREIVCVTFPGVVKMGDERGDGLERYRNVIFRARVVGWEP